MPNMRAALLLVLSGLAFTHAHPASAVNADVPVDETDATANANFTRTVTHRMPGTGVRQRSPLAAFFRSGTVVVYLLARVSADQLG